ncbi:MAG: phospholipase, partial [Snowella sp.]|nr:phospholipase [Snowella sp.]
MSCFHRLSYPALLNLAQALESGRLTIPCHCLELIPYVSSEMVQDLVNELDNLHLAGMTVSHITYWLRLLAQERILAQKISDTMDFVWTGEEFQGMESRDTAVVV